LTKEQIKSISLDRSGLSKDPSTSFLRMRLRLLRRDRHTLWQKMRAYMFEIFGMDKSSLSKVLKHTCSRSMKNYGRRPFQSK
jgi:hypothetical protein